MNTPNPLVPQGSLQQSKGKSNVRIAVFTILAIHVVLLCGLLIQGCKRPQPPTEDQTTVQPGIEPMTNATDLVDTNLPPLDTNIPVPAPGTVPPPPGGTTTTGAVSSAPIAVPVPPVVTPEPTPTPVPTETRVHVVARGESLSTIAQKEHVSLKALQEANPTVEPTKLQIGQKLNIPGGSTSTASTTSTTAVEPGATDVYVVKSGDALEKIAKNHNTTVKAIKALNGMKTDRINVGQKLKIPASQPAADTTAPAGTTNR